MSTSQTILLKDRHHYGTYLLEDSVRKSFDIGINCNRRDALISLVGKIEGKKIREILNNNETRARPK